MKKDKAIRMILAFAGILLVGTGVAFNAAAALGNDPIGIVYDGIRNTAGLTSGQLGTASNIVNVILLMIVFFTGRRYVNIGTFVYIIPYGGVVQLGTHLYGSLFRVQSLPVQIGGAFSGCFMLYLGVAMFIAADIGLDPFTGSVMVIKDALHKEYRLIKVCFDIGCIILGTVLGGKLGAVTLLTAVTAGPCIQFFAGKIRKLLLARICH